MTAPGASSVSSPSRGRIITFYSYKGGTGRSMAVANVAWILASQNQKVLVIDWDLEAPGLHRYFHPFLEDRELTSSPGLIDYFYDVVSAARSAVQRADRSEGESSQPPWWQEWTSLLRYSYPLNAGFLFDDKDAAAAFGPIDFVPAGRQMPDYGERVGHFDWKNFYERLGGGVLLEAVKQRLRERYDYVLIDSRTGMSDTSGVCTVQMPDDLVLCFTLNRQSMLGASAVARSATAQRKTKQGVPGLRIWPVPMRVELSERDRVEKARTTARTTFLEQLGPLVPSREGRERYWGGVEVLYQPYFAYEEVLAVFAERKHQTTSMLSSFEFLTKCVSNGVVSELKPFAEKARAEALRRYLPDSESAPVARPSGGKVYLSYDGDVANYAAPVFDALRAAGIDVWFDKTSLIPGDHFPTAMKDSLSAALVVIRLIGRIGKRGKWSALELELALAQRKRVIPVLCGLADVSSLPFSLSEFHATRISNPRTERDIGSLVSAVQQALGREAQKTVPSDPDDPHKGKWGGSPHSRGRILSATVTAIDETWFEVTLDVTSMTSEPLEGKVTFHVHPTFETESSVVEAVNGHATLRLVAWGAFTVGAELDNGQTVLELDLSQDTRFPQAFRSQ